MADTGIKDKWKAILSDRASAVLGCMRRSQALHVVGEDAIDNPSDIFCRKPAIQTRLGPVFFLLPTSRKALELNRWNK
jgi:hypothetical protein